MRFRCRVLTGTSLDAIRSELDLFGESGLAERCRAASFILLKLCGIAGRSDIIRSALRRSGGAGGLFEARGDVAVLGASRAALQELCALLEQSQPDAARGICTALDNFERTEFTLRLPAGSLHLGGRPKLMGVLNVTPDSFSDGGEHASLESAVEYGLRLAEAGADLIDVGGESTRPGATAVPEEQELRRVLPVVAELRRRIDVPISVDTSKYEVARQALEAGAAILNDVTALRGDARLASLAAQRGAPLVLMHMQGTPRTMQQAPQYGDLMGEIAEFFAERIEFAAAAGVHTGQIIVDPGIGFGKTPQHNLEILRRLGEFRSLGHPVLVGASRKSTIGQITGRAPGERLIGSVAAAVVAAVNGAHIVRVHDVAETLQALQVCESIRQGRLV